MDDPRPGTRGSPHSRREKRMTDKNSQLRLGAGTVPDPFGLARDPARQVSDEEAPDPDSPGSTATEDADLDDGVATGEPGDDTVRLGELD
jgi:hypothetical protein